MKFYAQLHFTVEFDASSIQDANTTVAHFFIPQEYMVKAHGEIKGTTIDVYPLPEAVEPSIITDPLGNGHDELEEVDETLS